MIDIELIRIVAAIVGLTAGLSGITFTVKRYVGKRRKSHTLQSHIYKLGQISGLWLSGVPPSLLTADKEDVTYLLREIKAPDTLVTKVSHLIDSEKVPAPSLQKIDKELMFFIHKRYSIGLAGVYSFSRILTRLYLTAAMKKEDEFSNRLQFMQSCFRTPLEKNISKVFPRNVKSGLIRLTKMSPTYISQEDFDVCKSIHRKITQYYGTPELENLIIAVSKHAKFEEKIRRSSKAEGAVGILRELRPLLVKVNDFFRRRSLTVDELKDFHEIIRTIVVDVIEEGILAKGLYSPIKREFSSISKDLKKFRGYWKEALRITAREAGIRNGEKPRVFGYTVNGREVRGGETFKDFTLFTISLRPKVAKHLLEDHEFREFIPKMIREIDELLM